MKILRAYLAQFALDFAIWINGKNDPLLIQAIYMYSKAALDDSATIPPTIWVKKR